MNRFWYHIDDKSTFWRPKSRKMFNFFKKKKQEPLSEAHPDYLKAKELFNQEQYSEALGLLVKAFDTDVHYKPLYELAGQSIAKLGGEQEAEMFQKASKALNIEDFKALGHHFYQSEHYPLCRIFLSEAFKIEKEVETANHLSIAYARRFDTKTAQNVLEQVHDMLDFWTLWFYGKVKIMNNDQKHIEGIIESISKAIDPSDPDPNLVIPRQKVQELLESYERLKTVSKPENKIRDWQYIMYGSVILDFFYDENQYVAGGRHVATWGQLL